MTAKKGPDAEDYEQGLNGLHAATLKVFGAFREIVVGIAERLDAAEKRIAELEQPKKRQRRKVSS